MAKLRKDIPKEYKWDLSKIYETEEKFLSDFAAAEAEIADYGRHEKTMLGSAEGLYAALVASTELGKKIEKMWTYAYLGFAINTADNAAQARMARVRSLACRADEASWFVGPYLIKLDKATVEEWYTACPSLKSYKRTIDKALAEKPYTLSDECEKLLTAMGECLDSHENIRSIFANSDLQFGKIKAEDGKKVQLDDRTYVMRLMSPLRRVRRAAFSTLYKTYKQFGNTLATTYSSYVKERTTLARLKGYESSLAASTFRDEVTPKIYESLITSVRSSLPVYHDYCELKREALGLPKLHMYDVYAPLVSECEREYGYDEAVREVLEVAKVFGEEYYETLRSGLTERGWVDVYPTENKQGGAFSTGCSGTEPYILLNYVGTYEDVSTLAHEAGHSMHSYFSRKYNEHQNSGYTIFVAEVASTVNELLLAHKKLRESTSVPEKLSILDGLMETYKGTLYRQTMFAEFERDMHALTERGEPLTAEVISERYYKLVCDYFGERVAVDRDIAYEWMRIPHFYSNFYVYKYATCISAASAIVKRIETEGDAYVGKYIEFLKCGGSRSPLDSLLVAGIDMTNPEVIEGAIADFSAAIKEYRALAGLGK
ncbi:MAG: oligoendopeptidase F [Clostridia bacterium]|nr:oligoendopeptidase F [Clostridia bacterium]